MLSKLKKSRIVKKIVRLLSFLLGFLPASKKLIIFESYLGRQYACNPKAIYEYMCEHYSDYTMYWSVQSKYLKNFEGTGTNTVRRYSVKWFFLMARARFWVSNTRMTLVIPKPRHTTYVQTWHGTPLKKLALDMQEVHMPKTTTEKYKKNFSKESSRWDYLISANEYSSEIFKRAFGFEKEMLEYGYPRNDVLYKGNRAENISNIKERLGIAPHKKVILYAPTWRDNQYYSVGHYKLDLALDLAKLQEMYSEKYVIVLRMHYIVSESFDLQPYEGFVYDFSNKEDISDLYLISDLLITDYSSVFFDYANLQRPIMFYTYDIEEYANVLRGFYFDLEKEAPGPLVKNMDELLEMLDEFDRHQEFLAYREKYSDFYNKFCYLEDGNATRNVVEHVFLESKLKRTSYDMG